MIDGKPLTEWEADQIRIIQNHYLMEEAAERRRLHEAALHQQRRVRGCIGSLIVGAGLWALIIVGAITLINTLR